MAATYNILAERTIRELSGGDVPNDSPYDQDYVIETWKDVINDDLKLEILRRRSGDEDDKSAHNQFIATYPDVAVQLDKPTGRVYIDLPDNFLSLKHNKGIVSISKMGASLKPMIRVHNPGVTAHLPHANLEQDNWGWYLEGRRVYWMRDIKRDKIDKVLVKLVIGNPNTLGNDDLIPVLPESINRLMEMVKQKILNRFPQDRLADGNPNIRQANV